MVAWLGPKLCPRGHRLGPGRINRSWQPCRCAGAVDPDPRFPGHNLMYCRINGCRAHWWPPEHVSRWPGKWVSGALIRADAPVS